MTLSSQGFLFLLLPPTLSSPDQALGVDLHRLVRPAPDLLKDLTHRLVSPLSVIDCQSQKIITSPHRIEPGTSPGSFLKLGQKLFFPTGMFRTAHPHGMDLGKTLLPCRAHTKESFLSRLFSRIPSQAFFSMVARPTPMKANSTRMSFSWKSALAGAVFGALTAIGPWFQGLPFSSAALFSAGLFLTYASIGVLVGWLPLGRNSFLTGGLVGFLYSLPGAIFTAVPYPLSPDAPAYYREFVGGGIRAVLLTLLFGTLAGGWAGWFRRPRS